MASVLLTPYILRYIMPSSAADIVAFIADSTVEVEGVGDVCSLSTFDLSRHGNSKYGAPHPGEASPSSPRLGAKGGGRSRQGKVEKSLLTFVATYPTWEPPLGAKGMLAAIDRWVSCCTPTVSSPVGLHTQCPNLICITCLFHQARRGPGLWGIKRAPVLDEHRDERRSRRSAPPPALHEPLQHRGRLSSSSLPAALFRNL